MQNYAHVRSHRLSNLAAADVVSVVACVVGAAAIACSISLNAMFFGHLGRSRHEAIVFGGMAAVVDLAKGILPVLIATIKSAFLWRAAGWAAFLVFTTASFVATLGFFAINRAAITAEESARGGFFQAWQQELAALIGEHRGIAERRSIGELDADIAVVLGETVLDKRGRSRNVGEFSDGCSKALPESAASCTKVLELKSQRAAAERRLALERRIEELREKLQRNTGNAGYVGGDPQVRRLAALFAVVVELSSGLLLALGIMGIDQRRMRRDDAAVIKDAAPATTPPTASGVSAEFTDMKDALAAYVRDRLVADRRAETPAALIFHDALAWIAERMGDATQLSPARLGRFLQHEQSIAAEKRGGRMIYRGVRLRTDALVETDKSHE